MERPLTWLTSGIPIHVVHYENLKQNKIHELKRMAAFLNVSETVTEERIRCVINNTEGNYHRKFDDRQKAYDMFTDKMKAYVISNMKTLAKYLPDSSPMPWELCFDPRLGNIPNISNVPSLPLNYNIPLENLLRK